jgi:RHS repeat-associated protein
MQASRTAALSQWVAKFFVAAAVLLSGLGTATSAQAAECTDTWTGPAEGVWGTKGNWSAGHVPTASDVACIPSGKTPEITGAEKQAVSLLIGAGSLKLSGGSIELMNVLEPSSIQGLIIGGGHRGGPGTLQVSGTLTWTTGGTFGTGTTELLSSAEGTISGGFPELEGRFINRGSFKLTSGEIIEYGASELINEGTFTINSEHFPAIELSNSATTAKLVNKGTLQKTAGTKEPTSIFVPVESEGGTVVAKTGTLNFQRKVTSSESTWQGTEGGTILFGGTITSSVKGGSWSGAISIDASTAGVKVEAVNGESANVTLTNGALRLESGTMTIRSLTLKGGEQTGPGTLRISKTLTWPGGGFTGSGETILLPGSEGTASYAWSYLERKFVNRGIFNVTGGLYVWGTPEIINEGTFYLNSTKVYGIENGSGANPLFVNAGVLQRTAGAEPTTVQARFQNEGSLKFVTSKIEFPNQVIVKASTATPNHACGGEPVDCATGNFFETQTDFEIGGRGVGLDLTRTYSAQAAKAEALGIFGYGWTNSFGDKLTSEESGAKQTLTESSGGTVTFTKSGASWIAPSWSRDVLSGSTEAGFTLMQPSQTKEKFSGSGRLESVTDRNGNETTLAYNGSGKLETITDPTGRKITLTYNGEGLVEKVKDPMGHEVKYAYEGKALKSVTLPGEASANWQFKYDASRRMTSITDGRGGKTTNEYDGSSRVISQTDPAERKLTFEYAPFHTKITNKATSAVTDEWFNSNNQPMSITHGFGTAAATTESFTYTGGLRVSRTDGNGHTWNFGYDGSGNRTSEVDPLEHETKWTYNEAHQVLTETKPSGEKKTIVRDANGNPETVSRPAPESKTQTVSYEYGPHGETKSMTDPLGHAWSYEYDSHGNLKAESDPEGDKRSWTYDEDSRVISAVSPRGNEEGAEAAKFTSSIERDAQGRPLKVTDPLEGTTKYTYDAATNIETITDPNGRKTKFTYDADNERTKVERPNGAIEEAGYDGAGQVTSQTDGNKQKTTYVRNVLEQPVEVIDPLERKTTATFDAAGNLKTKKDPDGRTTTYGYDNANQLKEISYSDGITPKATFGYDKNGNLTSLVDGTGESTFEYDQLDRLIHSKDGNGDAASWEYNLGDEPIGLTYPNGKSISRAYDKAGRLESVTDWLGHTTSFAYNKDSELRTTTFPSGTGNLDEYAFDRADRMSSVAMKKGAETLASLSYARDKAGQVESLISKGLPGAEEESFAYDENERLKSAGGGSYEYDSANNLTKAPGTTNAFDKASQLESATGATFTYDKEGERTKRTPSSGPATTYKYDQAENLTAVERPEEGETPTIAESFAYDGTGLLASRTVGLSTQHLTWDVSEGLPLLLNDGENSYLYGPTGLPIEQISSGEAPTYLHQDQLGSTRLLTNSSGEVAGSTTFAPYGAVAGKTGAASSPLGFAGQYTMGQSGLIYLRARFYDPATAQFMSVDPLMPVTRAPYFYAGGNPLTYVDRSGLEAELEIPCWPFCSPPPIVAKPFEEAANSFNDFANSLFGDPEEISGTVTVNPSVVEARSRESEEESQEDCEGRELVRKGEELLGRGHSKAGREKFNEWWRGLGRRDKGLYKEHDGPRPRKGG